MIRQLIITLVCNELTKPVNGKRHEPPASGGRVEAREEAMR